MKKLTKKRIKEEILRAVELQENTYWRGSRGVFLCHSFFGEDELTKQMRAWIKEQEVLTGYHSTVEFSHFITDADGKSVSDTSSCAAIFRTMILIEFAKSLGVKI